MRAWICLSMCSMWADDECKPPAALSVCMFVHLQMYVWVKFLRACVFFCMQMCVCVCVCMCVVLQLLLGWSVFILAWSQTFITSLLIAPFLHPSVPPAIYKSTAACLSLRANIQSFFFPVLSSPLTFLVSAKQTECSQIGSYMHIHPLFVISLDRMHICFDVLLFETKM